MSALKADASGAARTLKWKPELLERDEELAELASLVTAARRGGGGAILIEAAAGLGKTRLLTRLQEQAERAGMQVLSARATELEHEFPYGVVRQLFEGVLAKASGPEREALLDGAASAAAPVLEHKSTKLEAPAAPPGDLSFATLYGLYWLTANASQDEPLLLSVDDAQWVDEPSLGFLAFLTARLEEVPVLVAIASRPSEGEPESALVRLGGDPTTYRMSPGPLGHESTAKLVGDALGTKPQDSFSAACHEVTGGNPFLVSEPARTLIAEGVQPTDEQAAVVRGLVPEAIARSVLLRLASLSESARKLAHAVAILGDRCEVRQAAELAGLALAEGSVSADALRAVGILEPDSPLRFVHPLVASAIYSEIPIGARSVQHRRAAELMAAEGAPAQRTAVHLLSSEPAGDAGTSRILCSAAQAALDQGAPQPALAYVRRALAEPPSTDERADALELLLTAAARAADISGLAGYERELFETLTAEPERSMRCASDLALARIGAGQVDEARAVLEGAIEAANEADRPAMAIRLEAELIAFAQLPPAEARARFKRYEGKLSENTPAQRLALALRSWWAWMVGDPASEAADLAQRALAEGRIFTEQPFFIALGGTILVLIFADELDAAERAAEGLIETANERGGVVELTGGWFLRGYSALRRGEVSSAEADARQAVNLARLRGFLPAFPLISALLIEALVERDELDAAEKELELAGMSGEVPDGFWLGSILFTRGRLRLAQGRAREAADDLLALGERNARWGFTGAGTLTGAYAIRALVGLGELDEAIAMGKEELAKARCWGAPSMIAEALLALGIATTGKRGLVMLSEAASMLEPAPQRLLYATAFVELGSALRRERQRAEARDPLREGLDLARQCGAGALARRAADELRATGERVERHTVIGPEALTPSEHRVSEMAASGMTNREIATALYITIKTVEGHLRVSYDKLGISSRDELKQALSR